MELNNQKSFGERSVIIVGMISAIALVGDAMLYVVLPIYWQEAGLTALWQVGVLLSVNRFVRLPLNPVIGWLYHRIPLRTGLIVAVILAAFTTIGYGVWKGFAVWFILRSLWGIAWSFMRMGGYLTVIASSDDSNRGRLMGRYNGVWRLGSLAGVLFGGLFVPLAGLSTIAILFGILTIAALPLIFILRTSTSGDAAVQTQDVKGQFGLGIIWTKPVRKILITGLTVSLLLAVFGSSLSYVIDLNYPLGQMWLGIAITSTALSGILQAIRSAWEPFLATWIGHRSDGPKGRLPLFILMLSCAAAGYALLPWQSPIYLWILIVIFVMAISTSLTTLMDAMAADTARTSSVITVMTAYSVITDLGAALGPAFIYAMIGYPNGLVSAYIACAAVFLLVGYWHRPGHVRRTAVSREWRT